MEKIIEEIHNKLHDHIININKMDIGYERLPSSFYHNPGPPEIPGKFFSKSRVEQHKRLKIFSYMYGFSNRVEIALNTGKHRKKPSFEIHKDLIKYPEKLLKDNQGFYGIIIIRREELDRKDYSYGDIIEIVKESYERLFK
jgi:hypothetical protein